MRELTSMALRLHDGHLEILDQRKLPHEERWLSADSPRAMAEHIRVLAVRGAPLIGVAAALSLGLHARTASEAGLREEAEILRSARPTAVNLMWAVDRMLEVLEKSGREALLAEAVKIFDEDVELCRRIAEHGAELIDDGDGILTHCNTGGLATAGVGTALGIIRKAFESGKRVHVFADETRPLLQGSRLTAWELERLGIPCTLICDNMAASLLRTGRVQKIFVGADRIAANGDVANKIGTYSLAIAARHHRVPFYVAAPYSTLDRSCPNGEAIVIEERAPEEVRGSAGHQRTAAWNPAFDYTPRELITGIVTDERVL